MQLIQMVLALHGYQRKTFPTTLTNSARQGSQEDSTTTDVLTCMSHSHGFPFTASFMPFIVSQMYCSCRDWELTAPWTGALINVPTKFIVGDLDLTYNTPGVKDYIHKGGFKANVPNLEDVVVLEGVGHFINQEKPDEVSEHICEFFSKFLM